MKFIIFSKKFLPFLEDGDKISICNIRNNLQASNYVFPMIIVLAILCYTSLEFKFKLSERIQMKLSMKGRMLMTMFVCMNMVKAGVWEVRR